MASFPRTRTKDERSSVGAVIRTHTGSPTPPYSFTQSLSNGGTTGELSVISDVVTPDWRKRQRRGSIVMNDMQLSRSSRDTTAGTFTVGPHVNWGTSVYTGDLMSLVEAAVPAAGINTDIGNMAQIALAKAYARMNASDLLGGEILADLDKTVSMLRRPFQSARSLTMKMIRHRDKRIGKTACSAAKAASSAWLEYRYGWQPIILDADTIIQSTIQMKSGLNRQRLVARAQEADEASITSQFSGVIWLDPATASGTVKTTKRYRSCAGVIYDRCDRGTSERVDRMLGYRPRDLAATFWEVIPYSYVCDWFVNVGDWIQAVTPDPTVEVKASWVTSIVETTIEISNVSTSFDFNYGWCPPRVTYNGSLGGSVRRSLTIARESNPALSFTPVLTKKSLSTLHSVDGLSLLVTRILGDLKGLRH